MTGTSQSRMARTVVVSRAGGAMARRAWPSLTFGKAVTSPPAQKAAARSGQHHGRIRSPGVERAEVVPRSFVMLPPMEFSLSGRLM